ncbi:conserved hypothetical protein [Ricinus communis]|uniref:Uncharacterized protein n=1 Tax=Ricinus communis TaxID=3988 RepID=B9RA55_RICCO|nr:conserved hypothetical protein [Ricinus communis]
MNCDEILKINGETTEGMEQKDDRLAKCKSNEMERNKIRLMRAYVEKMDPSSKDSFRSGSSLA